MLSSKDLAERCRSTVYGRIFQRARSGLLAKGEVVSEGNTQL
jgi:hypothetical protein